MCVVLGWVGLGSVVVGLGSLVWWASVSVSGGCYVVLCGGVGGRGAKPGVGGCALSVGRCVFRGLGQDFAKMVHFRPSENLENNFRQHVVLLEYLPTRYCSKDLLPILFKRLLVHSLWLHAHPFCDDGHNWYSRRKRLPTQHTHRT